MAGRSVDARIKLNINIWWSCPPKNKESEEFIDVEVKKYFVADAKGKTAVITWITSRAAAMFRGSVQFFSSKAEFVLESGRKLERD